MKTTHYERQKYAPHLTGRVAWVTGAGRGLGRAIAVGLAHAGAKVAVTSRTLKDLATLEEQIESISEGAVLVVPGSVTEPDDMRDIAERIMATFGTLDILVNSAGISPSFSRAEDMLDDTWRSIIEVNLSGTFICCREAGRRMLEVGSGSIINVSSVHATSGFGRLAAYAASKGGIEALTRALAVEWAPRGIRVNCIAPGYFATRLSEPLLLNESLRHAVMGHTPLGRIADPDELVGAVNFLAGEESSFVTGAILPVDGGWAAT
jgi:NAD(P)-dependent dehydrogenase (short-subunit alcohol dehydrogenase family)